MGYKNYEDRQRWMRDNWLRRMLTVAKCRAKRKGIPFEITVEDIQGPTHCPVMGFELVVGPQGGRMSSYSLDRIDNSKGYVKGNVALISHRANSYKGDMTIENVRRMLAYMERSASRLEQM